MDQMHWHVLLSPTSEREMDVHHSHRMMICQFARELPRDKGRRYLPIGYTAVMHDLWNAHFFVSFLAVGA